MPTLFNENGCRFFFFSNEPIHIHITKGSAEEKIWLEPDIELNYFDGFTNAEIKTIMDIVFKNHSKFKTKWHEYFSK